MLGKKKKFKKEKQGEERILSGVSSSGVKE